MNHTSFLIFQLVALEFSESNMCNIFRDVSQVNWPLLIKMLQLTEVVDKNCLKHTLWIWHNNNTERKPWTTWRKLAVVVANVHGYEAGQELKEKAGVGK